MSSVVISGDTSGAITLSAPAVAGTNTITLPAGTGTIAVNGVSSNIVSGTAVASTSGTSIDFTGIPSWVKRITVMFNGVSTNGSSAVITQIGSGSITSSGYSGRSGYIINAGSSSVATVTNGFALDATGSSSEVRTGIMVIALQSANTYVSSCQICSTGSAIFGFGNGIVALSGTLDRVRITTGNGTDTFDAGSINILWE